MSTLLDEVDPRTPIDETGESNDVRAVYGHFGFLPWELVHFNLPYRDPGTDYWERRNGHSTLIMEAGLISTPQGRARIMPFGKYARATLLWICTEAKLTENPTIELGNSFREFQANIGVRHGSRASQLATLQAQALFKARITIESREKTDEGKLKHRDRDYGITVERNLWFTNDDAEEFDTSKAGQITLSGELFGSILEHGNPVNLEVWRHLQETTSSPMVLDVYTWLAIRLPKVTRPVRVSWEQLYEQFGSNSSLWKFKENFRVALSRALEVYPGANVTEEGEGTRGKGFKGITLYHSAHAVTPRAL